MTNKAALTEGIPHCAIIVGWISPLAANSAKISSFLSVLRATFDLNSTKYIFR